jgi:hypothetical protein
MYCGAAECKVQLPSFCSAPMQEGDTGMAAVFGRYYPEGCAYKLKAWAESATRARR